MSKKKLIRVEKAEGVTSIYDGTSISSHGLALGFVGKDESVKDGTKYRKQISNFVTCRETFCSIPRYALHEKLNKERGNIASFNPNVHNFDFDNARLLFGHSENSSNIKDKIFSGKRIVNILEEEAGWKEKSVITTVKHTTYKDTKNMFLFTGPKEWMVSPQMLSLVILLLRIPVSTRSSYDSNNYKELQQELNVISKSNQNRDTAFLSEIRKKIAKLMKNVNNVFTKDLDENWPLKDSKFIGYGGVNSLFKCSTGDTNLNDRFKSFVLQSE